MKVINDVWNMCINKCTTNGWLIGIMQTKGNNSACYEIIYNLREIRDDDYL